MSKRRKVIIGLIAGFCSVLILLGLYWENCRAAPASQLSEQTVAYLTEIGAYSAYYRGEEFTIDLASNSTTGYSWVILEQDKEGLALEIISYQEYPSGINEVGIGGYSRLKGTVTTAGQYQFILSYRQDWDNGDEALRYRVTVTSSTQAITDIQLAELLLSE